MLEEEFGSELDEILKLLGDLPDLTKIPPEFWEGLTASMAAKVRPALEKAALTAAGRLALEPGIGVDWSLVAEDAARWASSYTYDLVTGITDTTQRALQEKVEQFIREPGRTIGDLTKDLEPYFGKMRAEMIAVTETTRSFAEGERQAVAEWQKYGARLEAIWHTNRDELVCSICAPADGKPEGEWGMATGPPAHPRCRCWITHRSISDEISEADMEAAPAAARFAGWAAEYPSQIQGVLDDYREHSFININAYLRGMIADIPDADKRRIPILDKAIGLHKTEWAINVYRGFAPRQFGVETPEALVGQIIQDEGFVSTSLSEHVGRTFAFGHDGWTMRIHISKGTPMAYIPDEEEALLSRGSRIRFTGVERQVIRGVEIITIIGELL